MGRHTPTDQQRRLVALWDGSTQSKAAFARRHGVHPGTFASWVVRHQGVASVPPATFIRVSAAPEPAPAAPFAVRLDEHHLAFDGPPPPAWFAALLRELAPC